MKSVVQDVLQNEPQGLNIGQREQIVVVADGAIMIIKTEDSYKTTTTNLINAVKNIGFIVNKNQTKWMIVSRREHAQKTINDLSFEKVRNFKYLITKQKATKKYIENHSWKQLLFLTDRII